MPNDLKTPKAQPQPSGYNVSLRFQTKITSGHSVAGSGLVASVAGGQATAFFPSSRTLRTVAYNKARQLISVYGSPIWISPLEVPYPPRQGEEIPDALWDPSTGQWKGAKCKTLAWTPQMALASPAMWACYLAWVSMATMGWSAQDANDAAHLLWVLREKDGWVLGGGWNGPTKLTPSNLALKLPPDLTAEAIMKGRQG